ncbi:uncharacterized protein LOC141935998 [Strix uralensis]|uniref:uncharacterized protein LOC141935998 n=1 Tax=Strix uralensis TaxID=36305 RepID=UPI003DA6D7E0
MPLFKVTIGCFKLYEKVPIEKGKETTNSSKRGWISLTACIKQHQSEERLLLERSQMERQRCDLQSQIVMLQCQNKLFADKLDTYQTVAEKAAVRVAQCKYRKRRKCKKVHAVIAEAGVQWDPGRDPNSGQAVRKDMIEDHTQYEVNDIIERFKQRPGESLLSWTVRLQDQGVAGVTLDAGDSKKFLILSSNAFVQDTFQNNDQDINLLALAALGCNTKYPPENDWPASDRQWYTLRDCRQRMKEEGMKAAVFVGDADFMVWHPLSGTMRNRVIQTVPLAYKNVIMPLCINEMGDPLDEGIEKVQQLRDLEEWGPRGSAGNRDTRDSPKGSENRISRKEMFTALLKDSMSHEKIYGVPTNEPWRIYTQRGLNKPSKRVQSAKTKNPGTTQPTAPLLEPQRDLPSAHGGPPVSGSLVPGVKEDWAAFSDLYPLQEAREGNQYYNQHI